MPRTSPIAKNYAKALFKVAKKSNNIDKIRKELEIFNKSFTSDFAAELKNPAISRKDSVKIIKEVCSIISVSGVFVDFISVVAKNKRINLFGEINEEFNRIAKIEKNILEVEIISAQKLEDSQIANIKDVVSEQNKGKEIEIIQTVKSQILGGIQIKIGSNLIDASLRNQLERLKNQLILAVN